VQERGVRNAADVREEAVDLRVRQAPPGSDTGTPAPRSRDAAADDGRCGAMTSIIADALL
jgi:hypothetical protein